MGLVALVLIVAVFDLLSSDSLLRSLWSEAADPRGTMRRILDAVREREPWRRVR